MRKPEPAAGVVHIRLPTIIGVQDVTVRTSERLTSNNPGRAYRLRGQLIIELAPDANAHVKFHELAHVIFHARELGAKPTERLDPEPEADLFADAMAAMQRL